MSKKGERAFKGQTSGVGRVLLAIIETDSGNCTTRIGHFTACNRVEKSKIGVQNIVVSILLLV